MAMLKWLFSRHPMRNTEMRNFGMMDGCPNHAKSVVLPMHIGSLAFVPYRRSTGSLVTRMRGSSVLYVGEKNGLCNLRDGPLGLVRSATTAGTRSVLREPSHLPRSGGAPCSLPSVRHREGRAVGEFSAKCAPHRALCPLRWAALSQRHDQGRGRGVESGLAHGQATREAIHARAAEAIRQASPESDWYRRDLGAQGARVPHRRERPGEAPTDLVR